MLIAAARRLRRDPLSAAVTVLGLAVALAAVMLAALYIQTELSYDRQFRDGERLYRIGHSYILPGRAPLVGPYSPAPLLPAALAEVPGVEAGTRLTKGESQVTTGDRSFTAEGASVDATFLTLFDFPLLAGSADTALAEQDTVVLTESLARKLFGTVAVLGRDATINGVEHRVTAVMRDPGPLTHLRFEFLRMPGGKDAWTNAESHPRAWERNAPDTYLRLRSGADPAAVERDLQALLDRHDPKREGKTISRKLSLHRVADIHLSHTLPGDKVPAGNPDSLWAVGGISLLILVVAVVNATNLLTAQAVNRGREVAVRKALGATHAELARQFLAEALVVCAGAALLGLVIAEAALPAFNGLVERELALSLLPFWQVTAFLAGTGLLSGLLAGAYPALLLTRWRPDDILRGRGGPTGSARLRSALVIGQFAIAIGLVVGTVTIKAQLDHSRLTTLGFQTENVLVLSVANMENRAATKPEDRFLWPDQRTMETLRDELLKLPGVRAVTLSNMIPAASSTTISMIQRSDEETEISAGVMTVDPGFFDFYGVPLLAGRLLTEVPAPRPLPDIRADRTIRPVLLTESAARALGWGRPEEALGKLLGKPSERQSEVVGVIADVRLKSSRDAPEPLVVGISPWEWRDVSIRLGPGDPRPTVAEIEVLAKRLMPEFKTFHRFLADNIEALYQDEKRQARIFATFAGLAILLSAVGLFGLTALLAARRTKEIGIRRVVGASKPQVALMMVGQFTRPVLLANLLAWPAAWWLLSRWLERYAVRIELTPLPFIAAGLGALALAAAVVAIHALRVAAAPPVTALRYE